MQNIQIESTIDQLYKKSKNDFLQIIKGASKSLFRPMKPSDFKNAFLAISKEQGEDLVQLIKTNNIKNIVEFGTSFGISTLFLAQGVMNTGGHIVTTELIKAKAYQAIENFKSAGVDELIEVRIGDALDTLKNYNTSIDLLLLDGWKDLYLAVFQMLEHNFHSNTIIYVDNADMAESQYFLQAISQNSKYHLQYERGGKVAIIVLL